MENLQSQSRHNVRKRTYHTLQLHLLQRKAMALILFLKTAVWLLYFVGAWRIGCHNNGFFYSRYGNNSSILLIVVLKNWRFQSHIPICHCQEDYKNPDNNKCPNHFASL